MAYQQLWKGEKYKAVAGSRGIASYANQTKARIAFYSIASHEKAQFLPLDFEYTENLSTEWNHVSVYGRNDPLSTFQGTKRTISISFVVSATGHENALDNTIEVSNLMSLMYPTYSMFPGQAGDERGNHRAITSYNNASLIETAPLLKVHFSNIIIDPSQVTSTSGVNGHVKKVGLVCAANGVTVVPIFDDGVLVAGPAPVGAGPKKKKPSSGSTPDNYYSRKKSQKDTRIYPKYYKISTELTVFHTFPLGFVRKSNRTMDRGKHGFGAFPWAEQHVQNYRAK